MAPGRSVVSLRSGGSGIDVIHPEDRPALLEHWQNLLHLGESGEIEARLRHVDGGYRCAMRVVRGGAWMCDAYGPGVRSTAASAVVASAGAE